MRIIRPELKIDQERPFENDRLNREPKCVELTNLVQNITDPLVINLDGQWGEGKSTFVQMWQAHLKLAGKQSDKAEGFESIYIDAFAHDYMDDPFVAVVTSVYSQIKENFPEQEGLVNEVESFKNKAISAGKKVMTFGAGLAVRVATSGALDGEDFEAVSKDISKKSGSAVEKYLRNKFENDSEKEVIKQFRDQLQTLGKAVREYQNFPLLIIIDELDRCRPTFAIEMLEKIKHLFSVENVTFLLVTNNEQLECSIRSVYGESINAGLYLQKFITLSFYLPKSDSNGKGKNSPYMNFCLQLTKDHEFESNIRDSNSVVMQLCAIAEYYSMSLRQIEKAAQRLALLFSVADYEARELAVILSAWSVIDSCLLHSILMGKTNLKALTEKFKLAPIIDEMKVIKNHPSKKKALFAGVAWVIQVFGSKADRVNFSNEINSFAHGEFSFSDPREEALVVAERLVGYQK